MTVVEMKENKMTVKRCAHGCCPIKPNEGEEYCPDHKEKGKP